MSTSAPVVAVIGGGPAGLMAAEVLSRQGVQVHLFEAKPSVGRKFLLAGKGGLNITHAETIEPFLDRYGRERTYLEPMLRAFDGLAVRQWMQDLGFDSFVGSSGRVFPADMKSAPLLRAWLQRLRVSGVKFHVRKRWTGWDENGALVFSTPEGEQRVRADATILALGGGSWPQLGSDGAWLPVLAGKDVPVVPLAPANCGFDAGWSEHFRSRFAGQPLKSVVLAFQDADGEDQRKQGDCVVTATGLEGGLIYAQSRMLREALYARGVLTVQVDLAPQRSEAQLAAALKKPRGSASLSSHLRKQAHLDGVKAGILRECAPAGAFTDMTVLAKVIKAVPVRLNAPRPIAEAISSAGGVSLSGLDERLMLCAIPGVFCAGEMLDWEAPTGGYLLTACFASGRWAAEGALRWLETGAVSTGRQGRDTGRPAPATHRQHRRHEKGAM